MSSKYQSNSFNGIFRKGLVAMTLGAALFTGCYAPKAQTESNSSDITQLRSQQKNIASVTSKTLIDLQTKVKSIEGLKGVKGLLKAEAYLAARQEEHVVELARYRQTIAELKAEAKVLNLTTSNTVGQPVGPDGKPTGIYAHGPAIADNQEHITNTDKRVGTLRGEVEAQKKRYDDDVNRENRNNELTKLSNSYNIELRYAILKEQYDLRDPSQDVDTNNLDAVLGPRKSQKKRLDTLFYTLRKVSVESTPSNKKAWEKLETSLETICETRSSFEDKLTHAEESAMTYLTTVRGGQ